MKSRKYLAEILTKTIEYITFFLSVLKKSLNISCSQAPHRQVQKLDESEKDMYGPPVVNTSKRLRRAGHYALPIYIMDKTLVACWEPVAVEAIFKKGEEETL